MSARHLFVPSDALDYCDALVWDADGKRTCGEPGETHPRCTWRDCQRPATKPKIGGGGTWANLCGEHDAEINAAIDACDARALTRCWALAHGSKEKFVARMLGSAPEQGGKP